MADKFEEIFKQEHISEEIQEKIMSSLDDTAAKDELITKYEDYKEHHDVFVDYDSLHDTIADYCGSKESDYEKGTYQSVSSLIAYKTAKERNVCFVDTPLVQYSKKDKATELKTRIDASKKAFPKSSTIVLGPVETCCEKDSKKVFDPQTLSTILSSKEIQGFDTAIMPVSLTDNEKGTRHMVSLILYKDEKDGKRKAMLIDQCGKDAYKDSKDKIKDLLATNGYELAYEPDRIMDNRNDCAIFAAMINDAAVTKSAADLKTYIEELTAKPQNDKAAEVDNYNQECKKQVLDAYWDIYAANPLFEQYLKASGVDISTLDEAQKMQYLKAFNNGGVLAVEDELTNDDRVSDPAWKDEVRKAVAETNRALSQDFKEYADAEHPDHLFFRDQNNASNIIAFANKEKAYVEGEQAAFDQLVVTAKNLGKDTIAFGTFEKHPEYRAKLYLACLKHGLKMKNAPELESLKGYPEYTAIQDIISGEEKKKSEAEKAEKIKELREEFRAVDKELSAARLNFMNDYECRNLLHEYSHTRTDFRIAKDEKEAKLAEIQDKIKNTEPGKKLSELADKKAQLFQKGFAEGILDEKRANDFAHRRRSPIELKQKEGETDKDFADRKEKLEKAQKRPRLTEEILATDVQQRILRQALASRKTH